jgi:hypothetical protein
MAPRLVTKTRREVRRIAAEIDAAFDQDRIEKARSESAARRGTGSMARAFFLSGVVTA